MLLGCINSENESFCAASVNHPFMGALPAAFGSLSKHLDRPGRAVTADFLRKVLKLGLLRLEDLCDRIDFDPLDKQSILTQASAYPFRLTIRSTKQVEAPDS